MTDQEYKRIMRRHKTNPSNPFKLLAKWERLLRMKYSWKLQVRYWLVMIFIKGSEDYLIAKRLEYNPAYWDQFRQKLRRDNPSKTNLEIELHINNERKKYIYKTAH